jgi:ribose-phosphate pyrophosphokinase
VLAFDDEGTLAARLADALRWPLPDRCGDRFPDGETRLRLPPHLPPRWCCCAACSSPTRSSPSCCWPPPAPRARRPAPDAGQPLPGLHAAGHRLHAGEVVSQRHLGAAAGAGFDAVVTVDPHLHRVATMDEVVPGRRGVALSAAPLLAPGSRTAGARRAAAGPDEEAEQWVAARRRRAWTTRCARKQRHGDHEVEVRARGRDRGRAVVLLDDVASTGRTLLRGRAQACWRAAPPGRRGGHARPVRRRRRGAAARRGRAPPLEHRQRAARQQLRQRGAAAGRRRFGQRPADQPALPWLATAAAALATASASPR